jgi:hypothetical protein
MPPKPAQRIVEMIFSGPDEADAAPPPANSAESAGKNGSHDQPVRLLFRF